MKAMFDNCYTYGRDLRQIRNQIKEVKHEQEGTDRCNGGDC